MVKLLDIPINFPIKGVNPELADTDTMFDGRSEHYLSVGVSALKIIESALRDAAPPSRILDLPCGFGRVTRVLRARFPKAEIVACDLDHAAVDFASATFAAQPLYSNQDFRRLELGRTFDLIWVGSLLTHMPESQTLNFLDLAVRHMNAQSRLILTTHGAHVASRLRSSTYGLTELAACGLVADYHIHGYGYRGYSGSQTYGVSLTSRSWFEHLFSNSRLVIQSYQPRGWDRHQDVIVLRLREASGRLWRRIRRREKSFDASRHVATPLPAEAQARHDSATVEGFDERWYLSRYHDVAAAVINGDCQSGLVHYQTYGWKEARSFCDPCTSFEARQPPARAAYLGVSGGKRDAKVDEIWSSDPADEADENGWYWMAHPTVRARVNVLVTGRADKDAYDRLVELLQLQGCPIPIERALSLGCGFGALERDLYARGMISRLDAYDLASTAIVEASRQAEVAGMTGLQFHVADLETLRPPQRSMDVVLAHSSIHHVEHLESLYEVVRRTLRPHGLFHLNEFIGPSRFQWTDAQLALSNSFLEGLPERLRRLPSGKPKERLTRPTIEDMIAADPTEAVRSSDLISLLDKFFEIVEIRHTGGTLLHLVLGGIAQNFDPSSREDEARLARLFDLENKAITDGMITSDFAVIVAKPRCH